MYAETALQLATALVDQRTQRVEHLPIGVSPSTIQWQFVVDRAELLPDEYMAMMPSSNTPSA